ncbi:unnamed protein product [Adineta ricciae]|uniref:Uncharacterized protein n=1 Tax=Adineta ricciae TaxID=249248 RepID=A0A815NI02_ADIRI|nr:unnamed protein product [Adineta ricciae]
MSELLQRFRENIPQCPHEYFHDRGIVLTKNDSNFVFKPNIGHLLKPFPYKPAAILSATFAEVLFLDCDAYVTRDSDELFLSDSILAVWKLFQTNCAQNESELDSVVSVLNKNQVWNGLYMTKLINDNYPLFYKYATDGDKDTFRLAFRYKKVKPDHSMVPIFAGVTLCKTDSSSQHIYFNFLSHVRIFKYERIIYSLFTLGYTRIGLDDPNNNTFVFRHCRLLNAPTSCFHILKQETVQLDENDCFKGSIPLEEMDNHEYQSNESLPIGTLKNNEVLMSRTNHLMPHFIDNFVKFL